MRKIIVVFLFLFVAHTVFAQVQFENCSLVEALQKAKIENKYVMIMASTTG